MANQRMSIRCKACGEEKMLAKRYGCGYFTNGTCSEVRWDAFLDKHTFGLCSPEYEAEGNSSDIFELVYEHTDENGVPTGA